MKNGWKGLIGLGPGWIQTRECKSLLRQHSCVCNELVNSYHCLIWKTFIGSQRIQNCHYYTTFETSGWSINISGSNFVFGITNAIATTTHKQIILSKSWSSRIFSTCIKYIHSRLILPQLYSRKPLLYLFSIFLRKLLCLVGAKVFDEVVPFPKTHRNFRGPFASMFVSMFVESAVMYLTINLGFAIHMTPILVNEKLRGRWWAAILVQPSC